VLKLISTVFDVPHLTDRDANAGDLLDAFDFEQEPLPPMILHERDCADAE
jgi:hypothetical protein